MPKLVRLTKDRSLTAFDAALELFRADRSHGVLGIDVGRRETRGRRTRQLALRVYVETKLQQRAIPAIEFVHDGSTYSVVPDVVATGRRPRASHGVLGVFTGLHPGGKITVTDGVETYHGAVGHLEPSAEPSWLITAGHLFPSGTECEVWCAPDADTPPQPIGKLVRNLLDEGGADAALVELDSPSQDMLVDQNDRPELPWIERPYRTSELDGRSSQAFRPTSGQYTSIQDTSYGSGAWYQLESEARGLFEVHNPVRVEFLDTAEGDSGTPLVSPTEPRFGFGLLSGRMGSWYLFEPLKPVLEELELI